MVHRPYPRWWRGAHCPFYDADYLERVAVCRARSQSALARHEATRSSQHRGCTSLGFEDVVSPLSDEDEDDRDTAVGDDDVSAASPSVTLDDDAPFADVVRRASSLVWGIPDPRPHQVAATEKIIFDRRCGGKLLLVVRTGAGKLKAERARPTRGCATIIINPPTARARGLSAPNIGLFAPAGRSVGIDCSWRPPQTPHGASPESETRAANEGT
jgi:hypothetical protein